MADDRQQETQHELFTEFSSQPKRPERFPTLAKTQKPLLISTTLEQILMISIVLILVLCGVFFLGVLRGKSLNRLPSPAPAPRVQAPKTLPLQPSKSPAPAPRLPGKVPAQTAAPRPSADKPYTIQIVTHRKKEFADAEVSAIRKMGFTGFIIPSGEYFQVCAGQYASKEDAKKDLAFFQTKYKDSFLRRHS